jgi:50S ribosomal protein L16 3-hydroxylase
MVSYAPDGGGVGPHFDSYDVFLLQGLGKRLWRISDQQQRQLVEDAPLRILQHFESQQEWLLEAGDMLYLPPHYAHWGIAVGDCMTYSIGFRAPSAQELATQFLAHLQDTVTLDGFYTDPDLSIQTHPAEISAQMIEKTHDMLKNVTWDKADLSHFLGIYLTEPKAHVIFITPRKISKENFKSQLIKKSIKLTLQSQMLFIGDRIYINGLALRPEADALIDLQRLADNRILPPVQSYSEHLAESLYQWYQAGFLQF